MRYNIWSFEHNMWWGPAHHGYVKSREDAGEYSLTEAIDICKTANLFGQINESIVPAEPSLEDVLTPDSQILIELHTLRTHAKLALGYLADDMKTEARVELEKGLSQ